MRETLHRLVAALTDTALANRESGGSTGGKARYLRGDDQATLNGQLRTVISRIQRPLGTSAGTHLATALDLSSSILSVIGSIVDHRAKLPAVIFARAGRARRAIATADVPSSRRRYGADARDDRRGGDPSKYEALLTESVRLSTTRATATPRWRRSRRQSACRHRGSTGTSPARATSWPRSFGAQPTGCRRRPRDPRRSRRPRGRADRADRCVRQEIFDHPELAYVYYTERLNMAPADQKILRNLQRSTVESWVRLVTAIRSDWTVGEARFAVHAAMALVIDVGRLLHYDNTAASRLTVGRLLDLALLGRYRLRATLTAR